MSNNTQLSKLSSQLSSKLNLGTDGSDLIETLKATAFKEPATDAQMAALLIVSNQYNLNLRLTHEVQYQMRGEKKT